MDFYPYIESVEDVNAVVEAEYKLKYGKPLPPFFLKHMLAARRVTIHRAIDNERTVKLDRLGKLLIKNDTRDRVSIIEHIGGEFNKDAFEKEYHRRFLRGDLYAQRFTKRTGVPKARIYGKYRIFSLSRYHRDNIE